MRAWVFGVVRPVLRMAWWWLRQVTGDATYENYLGWAARRAPGGGGAEAMALAANSLRAEVLSRKEFYLEALARRYAHVSRCC